MQLKYHISKNMLHKLYWQERKSCSQIGKELGVHASVIHDYLISNNILRRSYSDALRFPINRPSVSDLSYILGVLEGDGSINVNGTLNLQTIDLDFAKNYYNKVRKIAPSRLVMLKRKTASGNLVYSVDTHRKVLNDILLALKFEDLSYSGKRQFINGYVDSEGCVSGRLWTKTTCMGCISISSSDLIVLRPISRYLRKLGIRNSIYSAIKKSSGKSQYSVNIFDKGSIRLFHNCFRFSIKRKQDRLDALVKSYAS